MTANWSLQSLGRGWRFGSVGPWSDANLSCPQSQLILQFGIWTYGNDGWMAILLQRLLDPMLVWTAFLCIQGSLMSSWAGTVKDRWCTGTFATWPTLTRLRKRCTRRKVSLKICAVVYWLLAQISSFFLFFFSFFFFSFFLLSFTVWEVAFHPTQPNEVFSCSEDGSVGLSSFKKGQETPAPRHFHNLLATRLSVNSFDISEDLLVYGTDNECLVYAHVPS